MGSSVQIIQNIFAAAGQLAGDFEGVLKTAVKIKNQAVQLSPKDTRRLANSIGYDVKGATKTAQGGYNSTSGTQIGASERLPDMPKDLIKTTGYVGTNVEYAVYQEYGTRTQQGRAFMRPAFQIVKSPGSGKEIADAWVEAMKAAYKQRKVDKKTFELRESV